MTAHVNIGGAWKQINGIWTNVSGTWKEITEGHVNVSGTWKKFYEKAVAIPAGLIIPFNGTSAPSGWSEFTGPNGRYIIAAGNGYSPTGSGESRPSISLATNTTGAHLGTTHNSYNKSGFTGAVGIQYAWNIFGGPNTAGSHSHSASWASNTWIPVYQSVNLIKATTGQAVFPQNAVVLGRQSFSGLTNIWTNSYYMLINNSTITTGGGGGGTASFGTAGSHRHHPNGYRSSAQAYTHPQLDAGSHSHIGSFTPSWSSKWAILSAWTNASAQFDLSAGMIAMWESLTPPEGWYLCNGSNGTLDLRSYFICLGNTSNHGTRSAGSNSMSISGSIGSVSHNHSWIPYLANQTQTISGNHVDNVSHSHTFSGSGTYLPPWYSLAFIQKAA